MIFECRVIGKEEIAGFLNFDQIITMLLLKQITDSKYR
jgi:hypothetical protein